MTRERIKDFKKIILPFFTNYLLKENYDNLGKSYAVDFAEDFSEILELADKALEKEPCTVDAKPIVHAHWNVIDQDREGDEGFVHIWETLCCSRCGMERTTEDGYIPQYCESCGAKMDE